MAKKARVYDGTALQELASAQTDLTAYSTTAQMNTAITDGVGLVPILTHTIGTAVSSVTVTDAFSATYDSYKIIITGGVGSTNIILGLSFPTITTGYYYSARNLTWAGATANNVGNNTSSFARIGYASTADTQANFELVNPFATKNTFLTGSYIAGISGGDAAYTAGVLLNASSISSFTITLSSGTITGGTIRVYGYKN